MSATGSLVKQMKHVMWENGLVCVLSCRMRIAGAQIPLEDVPSVQKEVVVRCRQAGKAVIVASHLLQSMIEYPTPTRAEVRGLPHLPATGIMLIFCPSGPVVSSTSTAWYISISDCQFHHASIHMQATVFWLQAFREAFFNVVHRWRTLQML